MAWSVRRICDTRCHKGLLTRLRRQPLVATRDYARSQQAGCLMISIKRARRLILFAIVLATALYFIPIPTLIFVVCGALDVSRHRNIRYELIEKYFTGNGIGTWFLSPFNLIADLFSY